MSDDSSASPDRSGEAPTAIPAAAAHRAVAVPATDLPPVPPRRTGTSNLPATDRSPTPPGLPSSGGLSAAHATTTTPSPTTGNGSTGHGSAGSAGPAGGSDAPDAGPGEPADGAAKRRRRGSRGGRNRSRAPQNPDGQGDDRPAAAATGEVGRSRTAPGGNRIAPGGGRPAGGATADAPVVDPAAPRPAIGDTRPAPQRPRVGDSRPGEGAPRAASPPGGAEGGGGDAGRRRRRGNGRPSDGRPADGRSAGGRPNAGRSGGGPRRGEAGQPVEAVIVDRPAEVDADTLERRRGRERKGRPVGRYLMVVHVQPTATQIAVLEGRSLIEHYVSRPSDDANQIDGNIYLGKVQNVLPGMEAAFVDIGTPKNAVLYRGDVRYDTDEVDAPAGDDAKGGPTRGRLPGPARNARIEQLLKPGQTVLCQVTKNPIGAKGARLAQEVSLPGRFVVLIPGSDTYGISKRLADDERKRLRRILDEVRPAGHGLIVRTAAEGATAEELQRDVARLLSQWQRIDELARTSRAPRLLYREPGMAVRVIREEFNREYRGVIIDDRELCDEVRDYVASISPGLADRVEYAGDSGDPLPVFERHHVHEQIHKALDRKVWLPSGGSLIIERTEALTVIDVNTGKNVGTSNLEETVFRNNMEAAEEIARQLRLRDIGGIIVIDFIDMEIVANRATVVKTFREALARDKTRTQVFDISELGLVEMTRKRVSEGLVESMSQTCPTCAGRGFVLDDTLL